MRAKCECKFIDLVNIDLFKNNLYGKAIREIFEVIGELNIAVVKCFKDIFNKDYFIKNTGGFIIFSLFVGQVICFIKYIIHGLYYIRKYIINLTQSYTNYINTKIDVNNINSPTKRKKGKSKTLRNVNIANIQSRNGLYHNISSKKKLFESSSKRNLTTIKPNYLFLNNKANNKNKSTNQETIRKKEASIYKSRNISMKIKIPIHEEESKINMKEYLTLSFNENDFDEIRDKDHRSFFLYFCHKFQINQIFINTFYIKEPFRPRSLKCIILIMTIELYFVINAMFYNEDYLTDLFYSTEEEKFYSFIKRRFNHFIYTSAVSGIISYFVGYVFIDEEKIKKIFRRNKEGELKLKYELVVIVQNIGRKFIIIIVFNCNLLCLYFMF